MNILNIICLWLGRITIIAIILIILFANIQGHYTLSINGKQLQKHEFRIGDKL